MEEPRNGFDLLEQLKEKNGKQIQNFKALSRFLDFKARDKGIPVYGQFELTPLCNFNCRMCYVHLNTEQLKGRSIMPVETWKDLMHQAWEAGMIQTTLTGGECLTYPGFDELYLYLRELGCETSIMTNGMLLDEQRICFFQKYKPARVQITLYGSNDDVYERVTGKRAFSTVIDNTKKAIEAGLPISLTVTPSTYLGEDVLETIKLGIGLTKSFNVSSNLFTPREDTGRSEQQDEIETELSVRIFRLLNELSGIPCNEIDEKNLPPAGGPYHDLECGLRCGGGRSAFVMTWEGIVMPCNRMDMIRANALTCGFAEAWTTINQSVKKWPVAPECRGCPYQSACNTCAANQLRFAEPGKQPKELCERTKNFVRHGLWTIPDCE